MPDRPCPVCHATTPCLIRAIPSHVVSYYRCPACGHVWTVPKDDPAGPIRHVTLPPKKPDTK